MCHAGTKRKPLTWNLKRRGNPVQPGREGACIMKNGIIIFVASLVVGFSGGYFLFGGAEESQPAIQDQQEDNTQVSENTEAKSEDDGKTEPAVTNTASEGEILQQKGCIACHSVSALNIEGGATGPDLSGAYENVEGKHGKTLDEFLKEPTSAVMSGVIGGNPLTEEERAKVVEALKLASEKQ